KSNNIKLLLDIQDKNIEIGENAIELRSYQGRMAKFITAKLTYTPAYCECCGVKNEDYTIYKNGTKTSRITLPISGVYTTYLNLKKQRFYCKARNALSVHLRRLFRNIVLFRIIRKQKSL